ncbi:MAG: hypothetical protein PHU14_15070 [Methylovulum sp.]|nr:hypothetical protein [Methylovulum sp.]
MITNLKLFYTNTLKPSINLKHHNIRGTTMATSNTVTITNKFNNGNNMTITFNAGSIHAPTDQQHSDVVKITPSGNVFTLELDCDRSGDAGIANKFRADCGGICHMFAPDKGSINGPAQLNFYFAITITLTPGGLSYPNTVYLGQGHYGSSNNWWIGGDRIISPSSSAAALTILDATVCTPDRLNTTICKPMYMLLVTGGTSSFILTSPQ